MLTCIWHSRFCIRIVSDEGFTGMLNAREPDPFSAIIGWQICL